MNREPRLSALIPRHGGYRNLKSFRVAQLVYDLTVRFCDRYIDKRSRTHDQMVQAARSGVQNIAEGSQASGTSKRTELKLTNVARASLEELRLDYEDFLRQRGLAQWDPNQPALRRFKARRCATLEEVRTWVDDERMRVRTSADKQGQTQTDTDEHGPLRAEPAAGPVRDRRCPSVPVHDRPFSSAQLAANAVLSLLNLCCHFLDRQLAAQAAAFEKEGGFTERLYRVRHERR
jgi:four helix bundle suffix protein